MSKRIPRDIAIIENYLNNGINIHHRLISFGDVDYDEGNEVSFASVEMALRGIDLMLTFSNKPITIKMSSYGGDPYEMLALYDKMHESPCKFIFYGRGTIMSAATWIMCGADERYLSKNTSVMVHDGSWGLEGNTTDIDIENNENKRLQSRLEEIYAENSFLDKKTWETLCKRNLYISAEETIKLGLADAIVPYKKRGNFRRGPRSESFEFPSSKTEIRKLVTKLYNRIQLQVPKNITVDIKKEEFESIKEYDHTKEEMEQMGVKMPEENNE